MSAVAEIRNSVTRLEYDKEYRWLPCSDCGEKTPAERYIVHEQKCLKCAQKEEMTHNEIVREEFRRNREIVDEEDMYHLSLLDSEKTEEEKF